MFWQSIKPLRAFLHGLVAASIGGAVSTLTLVYTDPSAIHLDSASLKKFGTVAASGAVFGVLAYFKRSPLP